MGRRLGGTPGLTRVVLFGSAARGEERAGSDLDVLILVRSVLGKRAVEERLPRLQEGAFETFGSRLRPLVYTRAEYRRKRALPLIRAIEREGEPLLPAEASA